ncbi:nodulation protein NodU [Amycolatopsis sp. GM8]|uniref:nodulation protein NodU n=1 Tax=Amycolatopsis sp. GM8 TaxID=2896530 RepID=UPI001F3C2658|nr:nodulation protein NodU [Amycolatopsis sp. GM8]
MRLRHDHNISLWRKDGPRVDLLNHWELERITGQKMHRTPFLDLTDQVEFINNLLAPHGIGLHDLVEIWGNPELSRDENYHLVHELPDLAFHSVSHLYSAILLDSEVFYDGTIVGFAVDRGPDRLLDRVPKAHWFAGCVVRAGEVAFFPVESPGPLYCEARDRFRMREGSLMALATASKASGECDWLPLLEERRFDRADVVERSQEVFDEIVRQVGPTLALDDAFTPEENLISAVMKVVQSFSVALMERNVRRTLETWAIDPADAHLAMAGGYALNCPTNSHLMERFGFRGFLAPPSVGDDGQSVGIGLAAFHKKAERRLRFTYPGAYLGRTDTDLAAALAEFDEFVAGVAEYDEQIAVDDLLDGPVAWFNGASEVGPRALGNRSLLGDPSSPTTKDKLNEIKQREWWRPVAPVVLEERMSDWFEAPEPSRYMLRTFTIRPDRRDRIPTVAHLDQSARVQSVSRAQNRELHELILAFERRTGVPMLANTSLNDKGEPIIDSIVEALHFCLSRGIRVAYVNRTRIELQGFAEFTADGPRPRTRAPFTDLPAERVRAVRDRDNPHQLPDLLLHLYLADLPLSQRLDIRDPEQARQVRIELDRRLADDPGLRVRAERTIERNAVHFAAFGTHPLVPHRSDDDAG